MLSLRMAATCPLLLKLLADAVATVTPPPLLVFEERCKGIRSTKKLSVFYVPKPVRDLSMLG